MLTGIATAVYNAYLRELRRGEVRGRRRRKLLRRARRQLLKLGDPDVIAPLEDFSFQTPFSSNILLLHFEFPLYDTGLPRLARAIRAARGNLVMVDVGANVGAVTYLVSRATPGKFLGIEANPRFRPSLAHNFAQIPGSQWRLVALTDQPRQLTARHHYLDGNSNIEPAPGGETLEFITLDDALAAAPDFAAPNLVKIDTEGFELRILRGGGKTLSSHHPTLFFEFFPEFIRREGGEPEDVFAVLRGHGYDYFMFYDGDGNFLVSLSGDQTEPLRSLRRYCELRHSFFDVAAFHRADRDLREVFQKSETEFFEQNSPC